MGTPFGNPVDPDGLARQFMRGGSASASGFGIPQEVRPPTIQPQSPFVPVTLDVRTPVPNLPAGITPSIVNFLIEGEGMRPLSGLSILGPSGLSSSHSWFKSAPVYGMAELVTVTNQTYLTVMSGQTIIYWHSGQYWSAISAICSTASMPKPAVPLPSVQIYEPVNDQNALVVIDTDQGTQGYAFMVPSDAGITQYSTLTNAPNGCRAVHYFDTRVIFANHVAGPGPTGARIPQRITWSARGDPVTYAEPDGGSEDLVSIRGPITALTDDNDRLIVLSEREIWGGDRISAPFDFVFRQLDGTVGCPHPRTVAKTPIGTIFLGHDQNVYLLPKGAGQAVPIGTPVWPKIKNDILVANRSSSPPPPHISMGVYDPARAKYFLLIEADGETTGMRRGFVFDLPERAWSQVSLPHNFYSAVYADAGNTPTQNNAFPGIYFGSSNGTVMGMASYDSRSALTTVAGSNYSGAALFPIGNPNPARKRFVSSLLIDYSNASCPSGSNLTIACSSDFGQSYDKQVGVALPFTLTSRQTAVDLGYTATYPSIEVRYESQKSGPWIRLQRMTAMVGDAGDTRSG